jgi:phosphoglycerate dehydrogenase-like enzyme
MKVLVIAPLRPEHLAQIAAVDGRIQVENTWDLFGPEIVADWPEHTVEWYLPAPFRSLPNTDAERSRRDALLAEAEVLCLTFPFPTRLVARAPQLRFVHQLPAGVSNLARGDLWHGPVPITSGRGAGNTLPIAEWAIAASLAQMKEFPRAHRQKAGGRLERRAFRARQVSGKSMGVIGLGGIGAHVARLAHGLGMRVIGMRRSVEPCEFVEHVYPPSALFEMLGLADVLVLATQLTHETHHLIDARALASMRRGAFVVNVARGELIDERALLASLQSGHLGGFAADVYEGEFEHQPPPDLLAFDNVILTPHVSGQTEHPSRASVDLFCDNLRRCLAGEPLLNQVDWLRGY